MYSLGWGVLTNHRETVKWWRKSAEQGLSQAQTSLGRMYSTGRGILRDYKEAVKWWRKSAEQGDSSAQYYLGKMYKEGRGVTQDYVMAHMYFNISVVNGSHIAIRERGSIEDEMTLSQIAEAQKIAREWMRTH
jgi:uncharacterized protein